MFFDKYCMGNSCYDFGNVLEIHFKIHFQFLFPAKENVGKRGFKWVFDSIRSSIKVLLKISIFDNLVTQT